MLTILFACLALAALAWRLLLLVRQARHVARHRDHVPDDFAALVPVEAHPKAADYPRDKVGVAAAEQVAPPGPHGPVPAQRGLEGSVGSWILCCAWSLRKFEDVKP